MFNGENCTLSIRTVSVIYSRDMALSSAGSSRMLRSTSSVSPFRLCRRGNTECASPIEKDRHAGDVLVDALVLFRQDVGAAVQVIKVVEQEILSKPVVEDRRHDLIASFYMVCFGTDLSGGLNMGRVRQFSGSMIQHQLHRLFCHFQVEL